VGVTTDCWGCLSRCCCWVQVQQVTWPLISTRIRIVSFHGTLFSCVGSGTYDVCEERVRQREKRRHQSRSLHGLVHFDVSRHQHITALARLLPSTSFTQSSTLSYVPLKVRGHRHCALLCARTRSCIDPPKQLVPSPMAFVLFNLPHTLVLLTTHPPCLVVAVQVGFKSAGHLAINRARLKEG
jgi:hypothetical protein